MVDTTNRIRVFVYGSLKAGHGLHNMLMLGKQNEFVGYDYIEGPWLLADMGAYPAIIWDDTGEHRVYGEVYVVDEETLASLDFAEGHPLFYRRTKVDTASGLRVWAYILNTGPDEYAEDWIEAGTWKPSDAEKEWINECA